MLPFDACFFTFFLGGDCLHGPPYPFVSSFSALVLSVLQLPIKMLSSCPPHTYIEGKNKPGFSLLEGLMGKIGEEVGADTALFFPPPNIRTQLPPFFPLAIQENKHSHPLSPLPPSCKRQQGTIVPLWQAIMPSSCFLLPSLVNSTRRQRVICFLFLTHRRKNPPLSLLSSRLRNLVVGWMICPPFPSSN